MWDIARNMYVDYMPTHNVYYRCENNKNQISITGSYRYFFIAYDKTYHVIRYDKIKKNVNNE